MQNNTVSQFAGEIVDAFEDYLVESRYVTPEQLPNPDRDECEDSPALIYGEDYATISECVEDLCARFNLCNRETPVPEQVRTTIFEELMDSFKEIIGKITDFEWDENDTRAMEEEVGDIFRRWGVAGI